MTEDSRLNTIPIDFLFEWWAERFNPAQIAGASGQASSSTEKRQAPRFAETPFTG